MSRYQPLGLPFGSSVEELARAVEAELYRIADGIDHRFDQEASAQVDKAQDGMLRYFDASVYDPGQGTGQYVYTNGVWSKFPDAALVYSYLPFKAYTFRYTPVSGLVADTSTNIFEVAPQAAGIYRVTVAQNTLYGVDLLAATVPLATVAPSAKIDEGFVVAELDGSGYTNGRAYFDYLLTETFVQGTSLRARPYTLTGTEILFGAGLANVQIAGAQDLPP